MGTDKSTLRMRDGRTFVQVAMDRLQHVCDRVWTSGLTAQATRMPTENIVDDDSLGGAGPMRGLLTSLIEARSRGMHGILVNPVDTPMLPWQSMRELLTRANEHNIPAVAVSDRMEPLIAAYPISTIDSLRQSMKANERSLRRWLKDREAHMTVALPVEQCRNINTPDDLEFL